MLRKFWNNWSLPIILALAVGFVLTLFFKDNDPSFGPPTLVLIIGGAVFSTWGLILSFKRGGK